jgi:hypothetical protein
VLLQPLLQFSDDEGWDQTAHPSTIDRQDAKSILLNGHLYLS